MAIIVVEVMLKPEILDPQGVAVGAALPRLGFTFAKSVRQGKRFEIEIEGNLKDYTKSINSVCLYLTIHFHLFSTIYF